LSISLANLSVLELFVLESVLFIEFLVLYFLVEVGIGEEVLLTFFISVFS
jgi:hypothetical protein